MIFNAKTQRMEKSAKSEFFFANFTSVLRVFASKIFLCLLVSSTNTPAATWQTEIKPGPRDNFTQAAFSLWLDETAPAPVALLVIAPGWNGDGRNAINDRHWQSFAREQRLGLVGVSLQSNGPDEQTVPYHAAAEGSGDALLKAITRFATDAKQPRLAQAPLLFWGHSAGGQFGYGMACHAPARVVAFAAIKGGVYLSKPTTATYGVPGLFIVGEQDSVERAMNITWLFETGRAQGAPWCLAYETGSAHDPDRANDLILPFFRGVLALRSAPAGAKLKPLGPSDGWIGIRATMDIHPASQLNPVPLPRTVWLPDQLTAEAWKTF
jgi:pimeloyl-ACP methyl ester carboxylesterase